MERRAIRGSALESTITLWQMDSDLGRSAKRRRLESDIGNPDPIAPISSLPTTQLDGSSPSPSLASEFDFYELWAELNSKRPAEGADSETLIGRSQEDSINALDWTPWLAPDVEQYLGAGGYGDVYKGKWKCIPDSVRPIPLVAVKEMRVVQLPLKDDKKRMKQLKREVEVWRDLKHENIVPFVGVCYSRGMPALVSLWMENGPITLYIKNPEVDPESLLLGIALGLEFLHNLKPKNIHGDVKGANVLINYRGQPCLVDFGISRILIDQSLWATTATHASGTVRWQAPEVMDGSEPTVTTESDVYSWAMTCLEVMTGRPPFDECRNDAQVLYKVTVKRETPRLPDAVSPYLLELWTQCWADDVDRPSMNTIIRELLSHYISTNTARLRYLCDIQSVFSQMLRGKIATAINILEAGLGPALDLLNAWRLLPPHFIISLLTSNRVVDVRTRDTSGEPPLLQAVRFSSEPVIRILLKNGAIPDMQGNNSITSLQEASRQGHEHIVRLLINYGADVNYRSGGRNSALWTACFHGHEPVVRALLEYGADARALDEDCLLAACRNGHEAIARLLLENDVDVDFEDRGVTTQAALQAASASGYEPIVRLLAEKGAHVNTQGGVYGSSLHAACLHGHDAVARFLLENGADVDSANDDGDTVLHLASAIGYESIVRLLIEKGADVNARGGEYGSALKAASRNGHTAIATVLLANGAEDDEDTRSDFEATGSDGEVTGRSDSAGRRV